MKSTEGFSQATFFAPQLMLKNVLAGMNFYAKAFGAAELRRWSNPDGSVHVAEMEINGSLFHLHEENQNSKQLSAESVGACTTVIGIFVDDPHAMVKNAEVAGAKITSAVKDFEYGYRQGIIVDPFGHQWLIQKRI